MARRSMLLRRGLMRLVARQFARAFCAWAAAANRGDAASTSGAETFSRAERAAKEDARLLTRLPESERPMVTQEFSMRARAKVPRAARQRFLDALTAKKLRAAANVGARDDVGMEWLATHPEARARAVREAIEEELKIHARATSKVTYRNLAARLVPLRRSCVIRLRSG